LGCFYCRISRSGSERRLIFHAVSPIRLGAIESGVGPLDELVDGLHRLIVGDPRGDGDMERLRKIRI